MISSLRIAAIAPALTLALMASPVRASVTFNVTGTFSDGGTLTGTFTTDDTLHTLIATSLTVAGGSSGIDSVIYNDASYFTAGPPSLPNGFYLYAPSSVNKGLTLFFTDPLTLSGATLTTSSSNFQQPVSTGVTTTRTVTSGMVTNAGPTAVPEPASWALMLIGFAGVGVAFRRNQVRLKVA